MWRLERVECQEPDLPLGFCAAYATVDEARAAAGQQARSPLRWQAPDRVTDRWVAVEPGGVVWLVGWEAGLQAERMPRRRGLCGGCGRYYALTVRERVRLHRDDSRACPGSGHKPTRAEVGPGV